jgi:cytidylate kinase
MVIVITGIMAAGKSTVAQLVAERLDRAVHVRGDLFRRMIVSGRAEPTAAGMSDPEVRAQLELRYRLSAAVADEYAAAGFDAVVQDIVLGADLPAYLELLRGRPRYLVVLAPSPDAVADRERHRAKTGYAGGFTPAGLDADLRATPRIGWWLDSSPLTADETAATILANLDRAAV